MAGKSGSGQYPEVIQPRPFSMGQTVEVPNPEVVVEEKDMEMVVLDGTTTVSDWRRL